MLKVIIFLFIIFFLILSSLMMILVKNSIHSLMFLIICFITSSLLLFLLEFEFIAFMFIVIYVGAIAVLFLFAIMMVENKNYEKSPGFVKKSQFFVSFFLGFLFFFVMNYEILSSIVVTPYLKSFYLNNYVNWFEKLDYLPDIEVIGQLLYTHYVLQFLIAGLILLLAAIGSLSLILEFKFSNLKTQKLFKQLSRNYSNSNFLN